MASKNVPATTLPEMRISSDYQVLKRTVLLYCAGAVLTFLFHVNSGSIAIFGFQIREQSLPIMRLLLWFTATYYFVGYILSFMQLRRLNNASIEEGYQARLMYKRAEDQLWELNAALDRIIQRWSSGPNLFDLRSLSEIYNQSLNISELSSGISQILRSNSVRIQSNNTISNDGKTVHEDRFVLELNRVDVDSLATIISDRIREPLTASLESKLDVINKQLIELEHTSPIWSDMRKRIAEDLPKFSRGIHSLSNRFAWEEVFNLYVWDFSSILAIYLLASFGVFQASLMSNTLNQISLILK